MKTIWWVIIFVAFTTYTILNFFYIMGSSDVGVLTSLGLAMDWPLLILGSFGIYKLYKYIRKRKIKSSTI